MAFDPDAYLAETDKALIEPPAKPPFDPDAYLAAPASVAPATAPFDPDAYLAAEPVASPDGRSFGENLRYYAREFARGFLAAPRDLAALAGKAAVSGSEVLVGGANLLTAGQAGRGFELAGYDPKTAKEAFGKLHSPEYRAAQQAVTDAEGVAGTVKAALSNPVTIAGAAIEAGPSMIMGGGLSRGALKVAPKLSKVVAGAIGEAGITAAQQAEQIRQANPGAGALSPEQMALAAGSGVLTGLIGVAGGKLLDRLGVVDIDTFIAGGGLTKPGALKSRVGQIVAGVVSEGLFQEFPQSAQEQIAANIATGRPWNEGVAEAAAMGGVVGGVMGAGGAVLGQGAEGGAQKTEVIDQQSEIGNPQSAMPDGSLRADGGERQILLSARKVSKVTGDKADLVNQVRQASGLAASVDVKDNQTYKVDRYEREQSNTGSGLGEKTDGRSAFATPSELEQGAPSDAGERGSPAEIDRQSVRLVEAAQRGKAILDDSHFSGLEKHPGTTAEHETFFRESDNRAVKRTYPGTFGVRMDGKMRGSTPADYLRRVELFNEVFGADVRVEGLWFGKSQLIGQLGESRPSVVVSQPWVDAADPDKPHPSYEQIATYMQRLGFEPADNGPRKGPVMSWVRKADGVRVDDARDDNFILGSEGAVIPIDLLVSRSAGNEGDRGSRAAMAGEAGRQGPEAVSAVAQKPGRDEYAPRLNDGSFTRAEKNAVLKTFDEFPFGESVQTRQGETVTFSPPKGMNPVEYIHHFLVKRFGDQGEAYSKSHSEMVSRLKETVESYDERILGEDNGQERIYYVKQISDSGKRSRHLVVAANADGQIVGWTHMLTKESYFEKLKTAERGLVEKYGAVDAKGNPVAPDQYERIKKDSPLYLGNHVWEQGSQPQAAPPDLTDNTTQGSGNVNAAPPDGATMRGFSERLAGDDSAPGNKQQILKSKGSYYQAQSIAQIREQVQARSDLELAEKTNRLGKDALKDGVDNDAVLSALELINRKHARGEDVQPLIDQVAAAGTAMGQLIRQFAELKTKSPAALIAMVESQMAQGNRFMRPEQRRTLDGLIQKDFAARDALNNASREFDLNPTFQGMETMARLEQAANQASLDMLTYAGRLQPQSGAKMFSQLIQGNLLVPISHARNIGSNVQMQMIRDFEQGVAAAGDLLHSLIRNSPRTVGLPSIAGRIEGAKKGIARGVKELWTGARPEEMIRGEINQRGFHPLEAWKDVLNPSRLPVNEKGKVSWDDYLKRIVEGTLGIPAEINFRALGLGDHPFRESAFQSVVHEQARLKKLKGAEKKFFLRKPDAETVRMALEESLASVYQNQNSLATGMQRLASVPLSKAGTIGAWIEAVALKPLFPYVQTPMNLAHIALQLASPEYSAARAVWFADKARKSAVPAEAAAYRRKAYQASGRVVAGQTMMIAASALVQAGLISGGADNDEKQRNLQYQTFPPNSLNLSGLKRFLYGEDPAWQPGDVTQNLFMYGFFGLDALIVANQKRAAERAGKEWNDSTLLRTPPLAELASSMVEMTLLKGAADVLNAITDGDYARLEQQYFRSLISAGLPNTLAAVSRAQQEYLPDYRGLDRIEALKAIALERNPFLDINALYPFRNDPLGQPIRRTPSGAQAWVYHIFDPAKTAKVSDDPVWNLIGRLYERTGNSSVIPSMPSRRLASDKLGPYEYERMNQLVGEERLKRANLLIKSPGFSRLAPDRQVELLAKAWADGSETGRRNYAARRAREEREMKQRRADGAATYEDLLKLIHGAR